MPIEIEKKYRLSKKQRDEVLQRLPEIGAKRLGQEFEINTLYAGNDLEPGRAVLRLRRVGKRGILTYKERTPSRSDVKHQREDETAVSDPEAMELILEALGFTPAVVYEKHRETWILEKTEESKRKKSKRATSKKAGALKETADLKHTEVPDPPEVSGKTEIVIDELPFGLFMEIEGSEASIRDVESKLAIKRLRTEHATYPQLTLKHGKDYDGVIESRFRES